MNLREPVKKNLDWFQNSGVMRPSDGFWGVAERIAIVKGNEAAAKIKSSFPCQTELLPEVVSVEHRRADCTIETAYLFDLAAEVLGKPEYKTVADNLIGFLFNRSGLRYVDPGSPKRGLWAWAMPIRMNGAWTDDSAWVGTLLLALAKRGRPELLEPGIQTVRTLLRYARDFFAFKKQYGRDARYVPVTEGIAGFNLNPHWMGLLAMALSFGAEADLETDYSEIIDAYHSTVLEGPAAYDENSRKNRQTDLPWPVAEYAYLSLTATLSYAKTKIASAETAAKTAADVLLSQQHSDGHFTAEWMETPAGGHLSDLIYTQNWATLGLYHAGKVFGVAAYSKACEKSLAYLAGIQDKSDSPVFAGCWRGMFDHNANDWGGGDCYEGGANSIYSGWTNAPISWAFLFADSGLSLLG
jgi:hypothetical protein